jgi:hypothetical protein
VESVQRFWAWGTPVFEKRQFSLEMQPNYNENFMKIRAVAYLFVLGQNIP